VGSPTWGGGYTAGDGSEGGAGGKTGGCGRGEVKASGGVGVAGVTFSFSFLSEEGA